MNTSEPDFIQIRAAMAAFELSSRVEPNAEISVERAFLPVGHRGVLDLRRQLVVGNRGMGKSFWTHSLLNPDLRARLMEFYSLRMLANTEVFVGFNGSDKINPTAPTIDEISAFLDTGTDPGLIWRAVLARIASRYLPNPDHKNLSAWVEFLQSDSMLYSTVLSAADDKLTSNGANLLIVFDALDRLGRDWSSIQKLTSALLSLAVRLQSFRSIRVKIFMRIDQFSDNNLFRFPDSSKIKNDHVSLIWRPAELYGLLLFELSRNVAARNQLQLIERNTLPSHCNFEDWTGLALQTRLVNAIAGEFMGNNAKQGRVYSWVLLHLSDTANTCSPRSFLTAWQKAASHHPAPTGRAVDRLGLQDGVRIASRYRLDELYEDYPWIRPALNALRREHVPMERAHLIGLWTEAGVVDEISQSSSSGPNYTPVSFLAGDDKLSALLSSMRDVGVMEVRNNGKINVPDIFRVDAEILRKGGVAVPKR